MDKTVPLGRVKGTLTPPCSKSYAQRALAASLLCGETSVLRNLEFCDDTRSALRCIETLGARVKHVDASTLSIEGGLHPRGKVLHVGESGLATRLFTPIASLCGMPVTIEGQGTLLRRPMHMMIEPLRRLGARVTLSKADALGGLDEIFPGPFDAIVSNPPYVPQSDLAAMHANVREYEPREALFVPDDDALRFYRAIARAGRRMLRPGGKLYFEIYERSAGQMRLMLGEEGYTDTEVREDLNGKPRMVCSRMN